MSKSISCSSSPFCQGGYLWHVACGEPRCLFYPWELVQEWACGWQQWIEKARGKGKKNSQWEQSTPSYALVLERFTSLKTIQHLHFTLGDTGSSPLKKIRDRGYLPIFRARWKRTLLHLQQSHRENRGNACGCVRGCDTLWLNPHPCLRTVRTETLNSVSAFQIEQQRFICRLYKLHPS